MLRGTDTEVLLKVAGLNKFISSVGLIGGSKDYPIPIGQGCALQEDNVTVEFNTPPTDNADEFVASIRYNLDTITSMVKDMGLEIAIIPSASYDEDQLQSPAAQTFGCDPDFNAWNGGKPNPKPNASDANLRSAGGHIHLEVEEKSKTLQYVQACDLFIGAPMMLFDKDTDRRKLYGKAGAFRPKPYGFEYRTPSNAWIKEESLIRWVWGQTEAAIKFINEGGVVPKEVQDCINNSDMDLLAQLMEEYKVNEPS